MPGMDWISFLACPVCKGQLQAEQGAYRCIACPRVYPVRMGIPDFRIVPDPYIGIEEEVEKAGNIYGNGAYSFETLVDRYYEYSPEVSARLQPRYKQGLKAGLERAKNFVEQAADKASRIPGPCLDIGCGTAGLTMLLQQQGKDVVGIDIALRWIILGRQRLRDAHAEAPLLCANAEALPFRDGVFGSVFSDSVLEHTGSTVNVAAESLRVLREGGFLYFNTANRNSLLEAYTGFPLSFLLPESSRCRIIERVCRTPYKTYPVSASGIRRLFGGLRDLRVEAFRPLLDAQAAGSGWKRQMIAFYKRLLQTRSGRSFLKRWGPFISISGWRQ